MKEIAKQIQQLIKEYRDTENSLAQARIHILMRVDAFSPAELECMAMDGIIRYEDIPAEKQTDFVKSMKSNGVQT